ncbi:hypothetical protein QQ020_13290 [Fulvivirgaceae bacterium BMA12]|uniref:Uncharacterized protein n=1 Tax=Agaribacillus aureus TaxID=3051825 RepID=A0ABT8L8F3_9BACT|nr:hypothetical protein [Fulvivirgaceae bacterium BMA12]
MKKYISLLAIIFSAYNANAQFKKLQFEDNTSTNFMTYNDLGSLKLGVYGDNGNIGKISLSGTRNNLTYGQGGELEFDGGYGTLASIIMKYTGGHQQTWLGITSSDSNYPVRVGIGTNSPDTELAVNGVIHSKEVKVDLNGWPDFVFKNDYDLRSLEELEDFILKNKHLPEIPNEVEAIKNGISLGEMNAKLLQKIEELTLYTIEQEKRLNGIESKNEKLKKENKSLKSINLKLLEIQGRLEKLEKKKSNKNGYDN